MLLSAPPLVTTFTSGGTTVSVYDTASSGKIAASDIKVAFTADHAVDRLTLRGSDTLAGVGIVVSGAPGVDKIRDHRSGTHGDVGFIASDSSIKSTDLKGNVAGFNLSGQTLGGVTFTDATTAPTGFYDTDGAHSIRVHGDLSGDVFLGGTGVTGDVLGRLRVSGGDLSGGVTVDGNAHKVKVRGGNFSGSLNVTGNLDRLVIARNDAGTGGTLMAGADITISGMLDSGRISAYQTSNGSVAFGITLATLDDRLKVGTHILHQGNLPFHDGDFGVVKA
jgi:hypothetical protein